MASFCADTSRKNGESHLGSASPFHYCLLIEYRGSWGSSAFKESDIAETVKNHVLKIHELNQPTRLQVIQKDPLVSGKKYAFFADCRPQYEQLFQFTFEKYEELLAFDFCSFIQHPATIPWQKIELPHFFICTNGQHDACCAKYGATLFNEMHGQYDHLWQTSHLGGDRFAANMLCLPYGMYYRRINNITLPQIFAAHSQKQMYLANFAGRASYPREIQVAEYFVRQQTQEFSIDAFKLVTSRGDENEATVTFVDRRGSEHHANIKKFIDPIAARFSCHADKEDYLQHYNLIKYWTTY